MNLPEPFVILLIGPPLSGKTTWIRQNFPTTDVISRDEIVMEVHGSRNYTEAFDNVDHKEVDRLLNQRLLDFSSEKRNVIVDMTNMTVKRRTATLNYFSKDYYKMAVIFPLLSDDEYQTRNLKRIKEENKDLPMHVIRNMISSYQSISPEEGFDKIISL